MSALRQNVVGRTRGNGGMVTVLPVLLAVNELREAYQEGRLSGVVGQLGRLGETSLGGAEAGRGGGEGEVVLFSWIDDLRSRAGGESRVEFILGVEGGVLPSPVDLDCTTPLLGCRAT